MLDYTVYLYTGIVQVICNCLGNCRPIYRSTTEIWFPTFKIFTIYSAQHIKVFN